MNRFKRFAQDSFVEPSSFQPPEDFDSVENQFSELYEKKKRMVQKRFEQEFPKWAEYLKSELGPGDEKGWAPYQVLNENKSEDKPDGPVTTFYMGDNGNIYSDDEADQRMLLVALYHNPRKLTYIKNINEVCMAFCVVIFREKPIWWAKARSFDQLQLAIKKGFNIKEKGKRGGKLKLPDEGGNRTPPKAHYSPDFPWSQGGGMSPNYGREFGGWG